jgi:hypothetical protein
MNQCVEPSRHALQEIDLTLASDLAGYGLVSNHKNGVVGFSIQVCPEPREAPLLTLQLQPQ